MWETHGSRYFALNCGGQKHDLAGSQKRNQGNNTCKPADAGYSDADQKIANH